MASFDTFMSLRNFSRGKISAYELEDSDPNIYNVKTDKSNLGQSVVKIEFKDDDEFLKVIDLNDDDMWFVRMINSYYSDYEFMDWYAVTNDFTEGYIIYGELDEDNIEKLRQIANVIYSKKFDLSDENFRIEFSKKLYEAFKTEVDNILSDYHIEKNREMRQVAEIEVNKDINNYFNEFGFTFVPYDALTTTVANLMMWYIRTNSLQLSIAELLPQIFETSKASLGGWPENSYEFQDEKYFDNSSFNREVDRQLTKILEKIEDGADGEGYSLQDYLDMVSRIRKKFEVDKWYDLPTKKDVRFKIQKFEMNPNKIEVRLSKGMKQRDLRLTEENFYHLLYQPTLFNLEEI